MQAKKKDTVKYFEKIRNKLWLQFDFLWSLFYHSIYTNIIVVKLNATASVLNTNQEQSLGRDLLLPLLVLLVLFLITSIWVCIFKHALSNSITLHWIPSICSFNFSFSPEVSTFSTLSTSCFCSCCCSSSNVSISWNFVLRDICALDWTESFS